MDLEVKKEFILLAAKQINQDCSARCFILKNTECMDTCFVEYLKVFNITTKVLRESGYQRNSRFVELAYGSGTDEWTRIVMFNDLPANLLGRPNYYFEENAFDPDKSR